MILMKKKKVNGAQLNYLFLSFLPLILVVAFEYFFTDLVSAGIARQTLSAVDVLLYLASATLMIAFVASTKLVSEHKYMLYLVILAVVVVKSVYVLRMGAM